jgi:hypothetical protein
MSHAEPKTLQDLIVPDEKHGAKLVFSPIETANYILTFSQKLRDLGEQIAKMGYE